MDNNIRSLEQTSSETKRALETIWQSLPDTQKHSIEQTIDKIPSKSNMWKLLVKLASTQAKLTMGNKTKVTIVGPANVGKSTLYNQFVSGNIGLAEVGPLPGTTREIREGTASLFNIIDTPGADAVGVSGEEDRIKAFSAASQADFLLIIFDATQGVKKSEQEIFNSLLKLDKPYIVVLNKMDLVKHDISQIILNTSRNLAIDSHRIIPISAKESHNLAKVLFAIASEEPEMMTALGKALPQYRWQLAWKIIVSSASLSGVIALTPLPIIDFIPLMINQSSMVLGIARIYDYHINKARARELVITFGMGFLGRSFFYELSKLGGIPGWILSAAIASSMTVVMGFAAVNWFDKGEKLTHKRMRELFDKVNTSLLNSLKNTRNRQKFKQKIEITLERSHLDEQSPSFQTDDMNLDEFQ